MIGISDEFAYVNVSNKPNCTTEFLDSETYISYAHRDIKKNEEWLGEKR